MKGLTSKPEVVLIAGTSFCGSTILSRILNYIPGILALGETYWITAHRRRREKDDIYCTTHGRSCRILSGILNQKILRPRDLFEALQKTFSDEKFIISADKNIDNFLKFWPRHETRVIVSVKNPYAICCSFKRKGPKYRRKARPIKEALAIFQRTYSQILDKENEFKSVIYVDLDLVAVETQSQLQRIADWLGLGELSKGFALGNIGYCNIGGNPHATKSTKMFLDNRWIRELTTRQKLDISSNSEVMDLYFRLLKKTRKS